MLLLVIMFIMLVLIMVVVMDGTGAPVAALLESSYSGPDSEEDDQHLRAL